MRAYKYDYLLDDHFEKIAFGTMIARAGSAIGGLASKALPAIKNFGAAAKAEGVKGTIGNFARGMFGMGSRGGAESAVHNAGQMAGMAQGVLGTAQAFMPSPPPPPPPPPPPGGSVRTASLREKQGTYTFKGADGSFSQKALHIAPYAAWIGSNLLDKEKHPVLKPALNLGAYGLYGAMAGHEALKNPEERITSGIDALALSAMGLADVARMRREARVAHT